MKKIIKLIVLLTILWYIHSEYERFKTEHIFNITEIQIDVENKVLIKDLYNGIESLKGTNILELDKTKLKSKILEDIRIKDVTIKKKMPDILYFNIKEKSPFAYIEYMGNIYITNKQGEVYGYMNESNKYDMPLFRISNKEDIKDFIEIMAKTNFKNEISQIYKVKNGIAITINNGLKVITNLKVKEEKYEIAEKLYNQIKPKTSNRQKIEYIDLRFEDYIIKKAEGDQK